MQERSPKNSREQFLIDRVQTKGIREAVLFCHIFDIQNKLGLQDFGLDVFQNYFAAYAILKHPDTLRAHRWATHPRREVYLKLPVVSSFISFAITLDQASTLAARQIMDDTDKIVGIARNLDSEELDKTVQSGVDILTKATKTLEKEQVPDTDTKELQEMLKLWLRETDKLKHLFDRVKPRLFLETGIDPSVLQRAANMLSAIYYQQGLTHEKKREIIEQYLQTVKPLIHQPSDTQEQF